MFRDFAVVIFRKVMEWDTVELKAGLESEECNANACFR